MDFRPIDFAAAAGVVSCLRPTAEKVWNVYIRFAPTQTALPQDAQNTITDDYGQDAGVKGMVHKGEIDLVVDQHDSVTNPEAAILHEVMDQGGMRCLRPAARWFISQPRS
jgi:hypothetical protein